MTIFLDMHRTYTRKSMKWLYILLGLLFLLLACFNLYNGDIIQLVFGCLLMVASFYHLFLGYLMHMGSLKCPRVTIDNENIELKNDFFKKATIIPWKQIQAINFLSYRIDFKLVTTDFEFAYLTRSETSLKIKQAFLELANSKNIFVTAKN